MRKLSHIKDFDSFLNPVNEGLNYGDQNICNRAFINGGPITFSDGKTLQPIEIVNVIDQARQHLVSNQPSTFRFAEESLNIILLAHSNKIPTMAVDKYMNMYINAEFVYSNLKMDYTLVAAVILHEIYHGLFNHIERSLNWISGTGKKKTPAVWHDTNLAADIEVNQTLVRTGAIKEDRLINEIHGLYLKNKGGDGGYGTNVVPLETILNDEEYMAKLRSMCPPPQKPGERPKNNQEIQTTKEWEQGYKEAWNKVAELIKNYGHQGAWDKLVEAGIVNAMGEIYKEKEIEDIQALQFLTVKTYEEYLNEDLSVEENEKGQTYKDGFMTAFGKLVNTLYKALNPDDNDLDDDDNGGDDGPKYKTDLKDEDLDEIEMPKNPSKKKKKGGEGDDDLPENINQEQDDDENDDENKDKKGKKSKKTKGKGGLKQPKENKEPSENDFSKLSSDLSKRTEGGNKSVSTQQKVEFGGNEGIGGTGSFVEDGLSDNDLKESGYSQDDIDKINKVRESNKKKNTSANIERLRENVKARLPKGHFVKRMLDAIEVSAEEYKNVWKKILEEFLAQKTRRAGVDKANGANDWIRKKSIAHGEYGIHRQKTAQDPQDLNVYVDVSGSMDLELLEIIAKSLVIFTKTYKYSAINICPWASTSNGVHKIEGFDKQGEDEVTKKILEIISEGASQCGGGTEAQAALAAMMDVIDETLNSPGKKKKDDVHVVITDGYFDYSNIESKITQVVKSSTERDDVAARTPEHTFWMIYDAEENHKQDWIKEIKKGKLIFIDSTMVKNNEK